MNERSRVIKFPTLGGQTVTVVFTSDIERSYGKWITGSEYQPGVAGAYQDRSDGSGVLLLRWKSSLATIAHEAFHAVFALFEYVGVKLENEITAQYLSHIIREILAVKRSASKG